MKKRYFIISYTIIFFLITTIGYLSFFTEKKSLVYIVDGVGQYYPSFLYIGKWLREVLSNLFRGNFSVPMFDLSIGMGESIIGCLNYYGFGDPLNILSIFATESNGMYWFAAMYFLRIYLAGIMFYYYCRYMKLDERLSVIGSFIYIFSDFSLSGGSEYIAFLSVLIYFPLILIGCEKALKRENYYVLSLSIAYAAVCNFYFLYMISLFLVVYCSIRCMYIYGKDKWQLGIRQTSICIGFYFIGICLAAPIFLPAVKAFMQSERSGVDIIGILTDVRKWLPDKNLLRQYVYGWKVYPGLIYWSGVPVFEAVVLVCALFFHKSKRNRQCILAVLLGSIPYCIPMTRYIFSGFGEGYNRWMFLLHFGYAVVFVCTLKEILVRVSRQKVRLILSVGISAGVICNIAVDIYYMNARLGWINNFVDSEYVKVCIDSPVGTSDVVSLDNSLYRVSNDSLTGINGRPENVAMLHDYNGLTFWFSIINGNTQKMVNQLGTIVQGSYRSYGLNHSAIYESLAGVKYYVGTEEAIVPLGYEKVETLSFNEQEWSVWRNNYALPLAYTYDSAISENNYNMQEYIEKMSIVLETVVLGEVDGLEKVVINENLNRLLPSVSQEKDGTINLRYGIDAETETYIMVSDDILPFAKSIVLETTEGKSKEIAIGYLYGCGSVFDDDGFIIRIVPQNIEKDKIEEIVNAVEVYTLSRNVLEKALLERAEDVVSVEKKSDNVFEVIVDTVKEKYVVLAVPYSDNWKAYIGGDETPVYRANTMYMAVKVGVGNSRIEFRYVPTELYIGLGLWILAIFVICYNKYRTGRWGAG